MDYLIEGIIIVFILSCPILFYYAAKSYFEYKDAGRSVPNATYSVTLAKSSKFREVSVSGKKVNIIKTYQGKRRKEDD